MEGHVYVAVWWIMNHCHERLAINEARLRHGMTPTGEAPQHRASVGHQIVAPTAMLAALHLMPEGQQWSAPMPLAATAPRRTSTQA